MEKRNSAMKYLVKINMHAITCLIGNKQIINHSPNFYIARLALLFVSYPSIQYYNSNFLQPLNKTFRSIQVNNIDSLFV